MNAVDEFIIYDNIEFTKKGWINRNRILVNGSDAYITVALKKDSDYLHIADRSLAAIWPEEKKKMLNRITESYRNAPFFKSVFPLLCKQLETEETNLFKFLFSTLTFIKEYLEISTPLVVSSSIPIDHTLRSAEKVLAICKFRGADSYINPIGGVELYSKDQFRQYGIELHFLKSNNIQYLQFSNEFIPFLSIIDLMMFNHKDQIKEFLNHYTIQ
jgi:hypothetical protein